MESFKTEHAVGIPMSSITHVGEELARESASASESVVSFRGSNSHGPFNSKQNKKFCIINWMRKLSIKANNYAQGIRQHVNLGPKFSKSVKGKSSIGGGGGERMFKQSFSAKKGEKLLKAFQCYLSTTSGPIAGMLFISTEKLAFCSNKPLTLTSPKGETARVPYKVLIPHRRVKRAIPSENANKPDQKYVQIVTVDDFEFWFMGFGSHQRSFKSLQHSIFKSQ
ncbi:putative GEM-like protein 8 [Ananas comosus]|uniref:GEM-like protein 8 n=1 Tax=Ananas comosus TaxID=4615 RepID=A0A6P5EQZ9_ANACO|nr:putative GEM-like protein 8 [Ananas comosus]